YAQGLGQRGEKVGGERLDRGVAAAVQHQARLVAEKARRIDAQRQIRPDALRGIAIDDRLRIALGPRAFHCSSSRGQDAAVINSCQASASSTSPTAPAHPPPPSPSTPSPPTPPPPP